jgi:hypothetical protein
MNANLLPGLAVCLIFLVLVAGIVLGALAISILWIVV